MSWEGWERTTELRWSLPRPSPDGPPQKVLQQAWRCTQSQEGRFGLVEWRELPSETEI